MIIEYRESNENKVKIHCADCGVHGKILMLELFGDLPIDDEIYNHAENFTINHQRRHPTHNPTVIIYERAET